MSETVRLTRDLRSAKAVIATISDWQRYGISFAIEACCTDPKEAWETLKSSGRYPNGTTRYAVHRKIMEWFDAAIDKVANPY